MKQVLMLCLTLLLAGCEDRGERPPVQPSLRASLPKHFDLSIHGYNYTDRIIGSFEVNGAGGGNLALSTATAGGGKTVCCFGWTEGTPLPRKLTIKWTARYCLRRYTSYGEAGVAIEDIWHEADIELKGPVPSDPRQLEIHFYPDGRIEAAITRERSVPRLQLTETPDGATRPGKQVHDPDCPTPFIRNYDTPIRVPAASSP